LTASSARLARVVSKLASVPTGRRGHGRVLDPEVAARQDVDLDRRRHAERHRAKRGRAHAHAGCREPPVRLRHRGAGLVAQGAVLREAVVHETGEQLLLALEQLVALLEERKLAAQREQRALRRRELQTARHVPVNPLSRPGDTCRGRRR
jgi:hypothetical protein